MNKRYFFNTLKALFLLLLVSGGTACNSWLDVKPENEQPNDEFWNNKEEVDAVMMGAYQQLRNSLELLVRWGELRGDVTILGPGLTSNENMLAVKGLEIKDTNPICKWQQFYNAIGRCNAVIRYAADVLPRDKTFTQKACDAYVAEAKWVRALCYFYLVRTFRDVPYVTEPYLNDSQEFRIPKSDGMEILKTIAADLRECAQQIPVAYDPGSWENKGRATVWALYALLADIYLWTEQYDETIAMCENIEKSGLYTLLPTESWYQIYNPGNSEESIIELQWSAAQLQTNNLFAWFYNESNNNNYAISDAAMSKFAEFPDETDVRGSGGSYIEASAKVWKYAGTATGVENLRESSQRDANWIFYRLADVLLMKAEAYVMRGAEGDSDAAYAIIRQIRERAGYTMHPDMPDSQSEAIDLVLDERLRELCFEGKRWFDLVRVAVRNDGQYKNKLVSLLLQNVAAKDRPLYQAKLQNTYGYYLPINESDMIASGGVLVQNPYYL